MGIRLATINDTKQILEIYTPYVETTSISFETIVPSIEDMEARIKHTLERNPWIVFEEDKCILGYAYASKHRERSAYKWAVDTSIYVRQDFTGKGIGKALYTSLISILKLQEYYNVYAGICLPNEASVRIHEYFGFKKIAHYNKVGYKFDMWHDVGWWELFLNQHEDKPSEPHSLKDISKEKIINIFNNLT